MNAVPPVAPFTTHPRQAPPRIIYSSWQPVRRHPVHLGGLQVYQAFVGDLRNTGNFEWPLRSLLALGGILLATPGGGIMPVTHAQMTALAAAVLVPTVLACLWLIRRGDPGRWNQP